MAPDPKPGDEVALMESQGSPTKSNADGVDILANVFIKERRMLWILFPQLVGFLCLFLDMLR